MVDRCLQSVGVVQVQTSAVNRGAWSLVREIDWRIGHKYKLYARKASAK